MKKLFVISSYIKHFFRSKSKFKVHSPFIYELITKVLVAEIPVSITEKVLKKRKELCANNTVLEVVDFGAGAVLKSKHKSRSKSKSKTKSKSKLVERSYKDEFKTVKKIARTALLKQKYTNLLYNLIKYSKPQVVVELGTSLGISTSMMALAAPYSKMFSMEGCASVASVAQQNIKKLGVKNVKLKLGEFDIAIPEVLNNVDKVDFVFFDGNHRKEPTIKYFERFLPYKHNDTIFVFDDIHWSRGMGEAWDFIKNHPETVVTLDLFQMGIVFFRKELSPQHFIYRF